MFVAGLVLTFALGASGALGVTSTALLGRRRNDVTAESSTAASEVDPQMLREVRDLFDLGASEFFCDGVYSQFSRSLLRLLAQHGKDAIRAIADYVFSGNPRPDVVSEALRWLSDLDDRETSSQRWAILQRTLRDPSPRVRDGAILGFAALNDTRALPVLLEAKNLEQIEELRALIEQVILQLERAK
ncbi:MAG: HEAT repeat domain-containing protein [Acidobacteria bacterium]|nr:HEAT repeat domain-containing protein [Acidobacteriota bacterium]